jgi:putative ABC transport system substrate-binding protein
MKRREFIGLLGGAAAAWPLAARAQQPAMPVIGFLSVPSPDETPDRVRPFHQGLSEAGYVEGRNVAVEYRWSGDQYDRLPVLARELVRRQVTVIAATGGLASALAAKTATATIPIVFQVGVDPIGAGLVDSLNRPGGNLTGVTTLNVELGQKRLELLHELVPKSTAIATLLNPANPNYESISRELHQAARTRGLLLHVLHATSERDVDAAFATLSELRAGALVIGPDGFFATRIKQFATLAIRYAMPTVYQYREFAVAGGLMSYTVSFPDLFRNVGVYTGRILKGEKPADLPVQQSTKTELIINLKTAKILGLTVPLPLLGRADEVIE